MFSVLIPVNFSRSSKNAVKYGIRLAKRRSVKIILLHAYHTVSQNRDTSNAVLLEESIVIKQRSTEKLNKIANRITQKSNAECEVISFEGFAADAIITNSLYLKPDLILIGTDILNAINHLVFGEITDELIRKINANILIIPDNAPKRPLHRMAFATYPWNDDSFELNFLTELSKDYESEIHIVHLLSENTTEKEINYDLKKHELEVDYTYDEQAFIFHNLQHPNLVEGLGQYVVQNDIDTLVVPKRESAVLERLFTHNVKKKPTYYTNIPILILQYHQTHRLQELPENEEAKDTAKVWKTN